MSKEYYKIIDINEFNNSINRLDNIKEDEKVENNLWTIKLSNGQIIREAKESDDALSKIIIYTPENFSGENINSKLGGIEEISY